MIRSLLSTSSLLCAVYLLGGNYAQAKDDIMPPPKSARVLLVTARGLSNDGITARRVEGTQRIEPDTVLSYLALNIGDEPSDEAMDRALKTLYATGLFEDVRIRLDGKTVIITVRENPIVNRIIFEGNDNIDKENLEKEVQLKPRQVYTLPRVQRDVQRLQELYRRSGRFNAVIEPKKIVREQNRVDIIFEINEGDTTGVRRIDFIGNKKISSGTLRNALITRESAWWRFFSKADVYDPDKVNVDRDLLRKFYLDEGYVDFRVLSAVAEITPDQRDFVLTFSVEEGERYKLGKINIQSSIRGVDTESLRSMLLSKKGDWYNAETIEKTVSKLSTELENRQFAFAEVVPDVNRNRDDLTVDLTYNIKEGQKVHIGRINVVGNERTIDKVIRREMLVADGDPLSANKLRLSEQHVKDLGFFEKVNVTQSDSTQPDRSDITVNVQEKATGELSVGGGYSTSDGLLGNVSLRERNFLGRGQEVALGATVGAKSKNFTFSFDDPYFMDYNFNVGTDIFLTTRDNQSESSYDERSEGFSIRGGYPLSERLRQLVSYTLRRDDIRNVSSTASRIIKAQAGDSITSEVGNDFVYDKRDSRLQPTEGYRLKLGTDVAGLGGDKHYGRLRGEGNYYYSIAEKWIVSTTAAGGYIKGFGEDIRINDRFFLGGDSLRGFRQSGVGPRDMTNGNDDALGGDWYSRGSVELTTPTPLPEELGFTFHIFSDVGTVGSNSEKVLPGEAFRDNLAPRVGAGFGVGWQSPFGPVRINLSRALVKEDYDKTQMLNFSFGTIF